jgi:hypothetical protein
VKIEKPKIYHIAKYPPPVGGRVKVWFDKATSHLLVEDETGRVGWDIYGVPLSDVVFETETTPRGAVRCLARGTIIATSNTRADQEARANIITTGRPIEFYWTRDKQWPIASARVALISKPDGGFTSCYAVDPSPRVASARSGQL